MLMIIAIISPLRYFSLLFAMADTPFRHDADATYADAAMLSLR